MFKAISLTFPPLFRMINLLALSEETIFDADKRPIAIGDGFETIIVPIMNQCAISAEERDRLRERYLKDNGKYLSEYVVNLDHYSDTSSGLWSCKGLSKDLNVFLTKMGYLLHAISDDGAGQDLIHHFVDLVCAKTSEEKFWQERVVSLKNRFKGLCEHGVLKYLPRAASQFKEDIDINRSREQVAARALIDLSKRKRGAQQALCEDETVPEKRQLIISM